MIGNKLFRSNNIESRIQEIFLFWHILDNPMLRSRLAQKPRGPYYVFNECSYLAEGNRSMYSFAHHKCGDMFVTYRKDWLNRCHQLKILDFNVNQKINYDLKSVGSYHPIGFNHLKVDNRQLYDIINQLVI